MQREVPRRGGGIASLDTRRCSLESVGAIHESPAVGISTTHRTKASFVQREVPRRGGGIASFDIGICTIESVGTPLPRRPMQAEPNGEMMVISQMQS